MYRLLSYRGFIILAMGNNMDMREEKRIIYEVNLSIDVTIYQDYCVWLKKHIQEMLALPGFIKAIVLKPEIDQSEKQSIIIQYQLENREALTQYFSQFAPQMRASGLERFKEKFTAERRIFNILKVIDLVTH